MAGQAQPPPCTAASKKQGVSGESSDAGQSADDIQIQRFDKDFRTWSGRTWSGRTWSGRTWSGRDVEWKDVEWEGRGSEGREWKGDWSWKDVEWKDCGVEESGVEGLWSGRDRGVEGRGVEGRGVEGRVRGKFGKIRSVMEVNMTSVLRGTCEDAFGMYARNVRGRLGKPVRYMRELVGVRGNMLRKMQGNKLTTDPYFTDKNTGKSRLCGTGGLGPICSTASAAAPRPGVVAGFRRKGRRGTCRAARGRLTSPGSPPPAASRRRSALRHRGRGGARDAAIGNPWEPALAFARPPPVTRRAPPAALSLRLRSPRARHRSKQLIKDAIMDNDFLKNLDSSQVREIVDSMYPREYPKGSYVIREGEAGSHLYVSAEGEFEVIKEQKVLGRMGPGKAFGELAILYNCTRTASIQALTSYESKLPFVLTWPSECDGRQVWVLDRRVFQQIMMRRPAAPGGQRQLLRSVPLLRNLSSDLLAKIRRRGFEVVINYDTLVFVEVQIATKSCIRALIL
ncbi:cGMP-dependent protein kinase, isozyme 1 [Gryllus bimaculatus]|nr:cGMP-dependent protein kinase, isozyme 1 [Gryllus bimaculatus]